MISTQVGFNDWFVVILEQSPTGLNSPSVILAEAPLHCITELINTDRWKLIRISFVCKAQSCDSSVGYKVT